VDTCQSIFSFPDQLLLPAAHVRAAHPEPSRPSRPSTELKWKGTTRPERATPEERTYREISRGVPEGAERERESLQREKGGIGRRAEGAREIGRGAGEETWVSTKEDKFQGRVPSDAKVRTRHLVSNLPSQGRSQGRSDEASKLKKVSRHFCHMVDPSWQKVKMRDEANWETRNVSVEREADENSGRGEAR
jgi:hypothetical protein